MRRLLTLLIAVGVAAPAAPAAAQVYPERIRSVARSRVEINQTEARRYQRGDNREEQTERTTRTLRIGANGQVDVANIAGDITVTRGGGNDATIEIVKTARGRTIEDAREMLQLVQVEVTERAGRAEVRTQYPRGDESRRNNRRNFNVSVAFTIAAPEGAQITAKSISGNVSVRDIKGELTLESVSGSIRIINGGRIASAKSVSGEVELSDTAVEGSLDASSVSGTVHLRKVKARRLDLGSVSGDVVVEDVDCDRVSGQSVSGAVRFAGTLARGGRYEFTSHSGEVRIAVDGNTGFEVDANSFSGSVRSDLSLTLQGGRGRGGQRAIHGVFGDGSAVLDLTTFSGSILITKR